ncbi:MAG: hypothetical protein QM702_04290 [Rubrivivax sp.]
MAAPIALWCALMAAALMLIRGKQIRDFRQLLDQKFGPLSDNEDVAELGHSLLVAGLLLVAVVCLIVPALPF